jgi:adenosylcobyric acid synthase
MTARGSLLIAGTSSDAGKSLVTAGICRWLARQGVRVAPFKAQNMSNNSAVTPDGAEIGRAQAMQAAACGVPPEALMNPVLLKPGSDHRSQLVVLGRVVGHADAAGYWRSGSGRAELIETVLASYDELRARFDVVVCEGAGSPAEINLRSFDLANMGLARARGLPVVVVGDIDRGGVLASLYGTLALLDADDQALICGFVVNKFRGDYGLLAPGLDRIAALTGRPVLGVLPYLAGVWLDAEDALSAHGSYPRGQIESRLAGDETLRVAVIRLPRISNFTDVDALALEPGVVVSFVTTPSEVADADLVVVPGTKATVADLDWLRGQRLDTALRVRAAAGRPILGICGGYQMLGLRIDDGVESAAQRTCGLGLLPVTTSFAPAKTLARPTGYAGAEPVAGYEIHHGVVDATAAEPWFTDSQADAATGSSQADAATGGSRAGATYGTLWHGVLENDAFRRTFLTEVARRTGRPFTVAPDTCFAAARQTQLDMMADAVSEHLDTDELWRLIEHGPTPGLPALPPGAR